MNAGNNKTLEKLGFQNAGLGSSIGESALSVKGYGVVYPRKEIVEKQ
jgi:hypothetical protein